MRELIFVVYIKVQELKDKLVSFIRLWLFISYLIKNKIFGSKDSSLPLKVLRRFIELECYGYSQNLVLGRSSVKSAVLFSALVDKYFEDKSKKTLDQLLEVLKEEFILRGENGRK